MSAVFKSVLPEISISPVLRVLLQSFQAEAPIREVRPPSWVLNIVSFFFYDPRLFSRGQLFP